MPKSEAKLKRTHQKAWLDKEAKRLESLVDSWEGSTLAGIGLKATDGLFYREEEIPEMIVYSQAFEDAILKIKEKIRTVRMRLVTEGKMPMSYYRFTARRYDTPRDQDIESDMQRELRYAKEKITHEIEQRAKAGEFKGADLSDIIAMQHEIAELKVKLAEAQADKRARAASHTKREERKHKQPTKAERKAKRDALGLR